MNSLAHLLLGLRELVETFSEEKFSAGKCSISQINLLQYFKNEILTENVGMI